MGWEGKGRGGSLVPSTYIRTQQPGLRFLIVIVILIELCVARDIEHRHISGRFNCAETRRGEVRRDAIALYVDGRAFCGERSTIATCNYMNGSMNEHRES